MTISTVDNSTGAITAGNGMATAAHGMKPETPSIAPYLGKNIVNIMTEETGSSAGKSVAVNATGEKTRTLKCPNTTGTDTVAMANKKNMNTVEIIPADGISTMTTYNKKETKLSFGKNNE